jgi:hypothetical protein
MPLRCDQEQILRPLLQRLEAISSLVGFWGGKVVRQKRLSLKFYCSHGSNRGGNSGWSGEKDLWF